MMSQNKEMRSKNKLKVKEMRSKNKLKMEEMRKLIQEKYDSELLTK